MTPRPVAEILEQAQRENWPTSSIDAMANHHLHNEADEQPHTSVWFTPTQQIHTMRGTHEQHHPKDPPVRRQAQ